MDYNKMISEINFSGKENGWVFAPDFDKYKEAFAHHQSLTSIFSSGRPLEEMRDTYIYLRKRLSGAYLAFQACKAETSKSLEIATLYDLDSFDLERQIKSIGSLRVEVIEMLSKVFWYEVFFEKYAQNPTLHLPEIQVGKLLIGKEGA